MIDSDQLSLVAATLRRRALRSLSNILLLLMMALLGACASSPSSNGGRYTMSQDAAPDQPVDVSQVPDAVPRWEPPSRYGNKSPYVVWGKSYKVMDSAVGYKERGIASWYGKKFHGFKTSNGETYDMYAMSAAHKTLPIPSFARVTNLKNGKSVIVRVNDRGPFHEDRIIDLSYAAAWKLGYLDKGTAYVEVEAITPSSPGALPETRVAAVNSPPPTTDTPVQATRLPAATLPVQAAGTAAAVTTGAAITAAPLPTPEVSSVSSPVNKTSDKAIALFVQVGAFASLESANRLLDRVKQLVDAPVFVSSGEAGSSLHRVRVGPMYNQADAERIKAKLDASELGTSMIIQRPVADALSG